MRKRRLILWLACACLLLACAGCGEAETQEAQMPAEETNPTAGMDVPEDSTPPAEETGPFTVYSDDQITITVPAAYAELVRVDDIGSDNIYTVIANLYYAPDYKESEVYTPQTCGGWMLTVERLDPHIAAHTEGSGIRCRATDGEYVYLEERPEEGAYDGDPAHEEEFQAVLDAIQVDYGGLEPFTEEDLAMFW